MKNRIKKAEERLEKAMNKVQRTEKQMFVLTEKKKSNIWINTRLKINIKLDEVKAKLDEAQKERILANKELRIAREEETVNPEEQKKVKNAEYQKKHREAKKEAGKRINLFVPAETKTRIAELKAEWECTEAEVITRLINQQQ